MTKRPIQLQVPATSANFGPGFDSMGLALEKYLTVSAELFEDWLITSAADDLATLPSGKDNLIAQAAIRTAETFNQTMPALKLITASDIPLARGLGSSSSAIIAGIELANYYCELKLTQAAKLLLATEIEGHPDNVGPCLTGDFFIGMYNGVDLYHSVLPLEGVDIIVSIPPYPVKTEDARRVIPQYYAKDEAVEHNAANNVLISSLVQKDYVQMGQMMMADRFHEPYRRSMIQEFDDIHHISKSWGAYATVISGAGPTVLTICPEGKGEGIAEQLRAGVPSCPHEVVGIHSGSIEVEEL